MRSSRSGRPPAGAARRSVPLLRSSRSLSSTTRSWTTNTGRWSTFLSGSPRSSPPLHQPTPPVIPWRVALLRAHFVLPSPRPPHLSLFPSALKIVAAVSPPSLGVGSDTVSRSAYGKGTAARFIYFSLCTMAHGMFFLAPTEKTRFCGPCVTFYKNIL